MESTSDFDLSGEMPEQSSTFAGIQIIPSGGYCFLAKAQRDGKWWALKGLKVDYRHIPAYNEALKKEYDVLASLQHPNVVSVSGFENIEGLGWCIVMEYVGGTNLRAALANGMTKECKLRVIHELMDALEYIHKKQIVHRDIKPSNIMLTDDGAHVKLIDFGLSDSHIYTFLKQPSGTENYASPEQKAYPKPDARNDIYSLGCVIGRMHIGSQYHKVIVRCKKDIDKRYQSIDELRKALDRVGHHSFYYWASLILLLLSLLLAGITASMYWLDDIYVISRTIGIIDDEFCKDGLSYRTLPTSDPMVEIIPRSDGKPYSGDITIPEYVHHKGVDYCVVRIADSTFCKCEALEAIVLPQSLRSIGDGAFADCTGLGTLNIPDSVVWAGDHMLRECTYLRSVRLSQSLDELPPYCFSGCSNLHYVSLHEGIITLRRDAFGASAIDSISLPASLRTIERGVFWECTNLKYIHLPAGIERIGDFVFWHCTSLTDVYVDRAEPLVITNIFQNLRNVKLHVPKGSLQAYRNASGWNALEVVEN